MTSTPLLKSFKGRVQCHNDVIERTELVERRLVLATAADTLVSVPLRSLLFYVFEFLCSFVLLGNAYKEGKLHCDTMIIAMAREFQRDVHRPCIFVFSR